MEELFLLAKTETLLQKQEKRKMSNYKSIW